MLIMFLHLVSIVTERDQVLVGSGPIEIRVYCVYSSVAVYLVYNNSINRLCAWVICAPGWGYNYFVQNSSSPIKVKFGVNSPEDRGDDRYQLHCPIRGPLRDMIKNRFLLEQVSITAMPRSILRTWMLNVLPRV